MTSAVRTRRFNYTDLAYYGAPVLVCLAVHAAGFRTWFLGDDFEWLALRLEVHSFPDLIRVLFEPMAQGTVRTLSERLFYLAGFGLFGLNPTPFHLVAFATEFLNLILIAAIARRLTGSKTAGLIAPVLWIANPAQSVILGLIFLFNQVLCAFFILAAFYCFLHYVETGRRRYYAAQWIAFVLGFGALETMLMYPAVAATFAYVKARRYFASTLPMFVVSLLYTAAHLFIVPRSGNPNYQMSFDRDLIRTLAAYWSYTTSGWMPGSDGWRQPTFYLSVMLLLTTLLAAFTFGRTRQGDTVPLFLLSWFVLFLAPVLPLKAHLTTYYASIPAIGISILAAWAIPLWLVRDWAYRIAALTAAALYLLIGIGGIELGLRHYRQISKRVQAMVLGVQSVVHEHPGHGIFLAGLDDDLFWYGVYNHPFQILGLPRPHLAPLDRNRITPLSDVSQFVVPPESVLRSIASGQAIVIAVSPEPAKEITWSYRETLAAQLPSFAHNIDVADPVYASLLGDGWYAASAGTRWLGASAVLRMAGPPSPSSSLYISGFCPDAEVAQGAVRLTVELDGRPLGSSELNRGGEAFQIAFPAATAAGRREMQVRIQVSRTFRRPNEITDRSLMITTIAVR